MRAATSAPMRNPTAVWRWDAGRFAADTDIAGEDFGSTYITGRPISYICARYRESRVLAWAAALHGRPGRSAHRAPTRVGRQRRSPVSPQSSGASNKAPRSRVGSHEARFSALLFEMHRKSGKTGNSRQASFFFFPLLFCRESWKCFARVF